MSYTAPTIDEYLRKRLMPVEGVIPRLAGIEMFGASIPVGPVGGDLFEYINFQQRYDIESRIRRALELSRQFLKPLPAGASPANSVEDHAQWLKSKLSGEPEMETAYRVARASEQLRLAEDLQNLFQTAGVLVVDAEGHGIISAKIASTIHDTFHAFMLSELDRWGRTTPEMFERINLRLAHSVTARNALGRNEDSLAREVATMLYGELNPAGHFRFVNFGHPPPLLYSAQCGKFLDLDRSRMVQFLPLGLEIPQDHPDRSRYESMHFRLCQVNASDVLELRLARPGDALFLYTDGAYDGSDPAERAQLESILREHAQRSAKEICAALLDHALQRDARLRHSDSGATIDDKTVFVVKRTQ